MSTLTTNLSLSKAADTDNAEVYLHTSLAAALDILDAVLGTVNVGSTWTNPAVTQGGTTPTFSTQSAVYTQIGKWVFADLEITATSAGSATNDIIVSSLPVAPAHTGSYATIGQFTIRNSGGSAAYVGSAVAVSSTNIKFYSNLGTGGAFLGNTNGPSFALANGDVISLKLFYRAA